MASPNNTVIQQGGSLTDAQGNVWSINPSEQVTENGQLAGYTAGVVEAAYEGGNVWQENGQHLWWEWNPSAPDNYTGWSPSAGTFTSPVPSGQGSPDNTIIYPGNGAITDGQGNIWNVNGNGQVLEDGQLAGYTAGVIEAAYENGNVWQENGQHLWWEWNPSNPDNYTGWSPSVGTPTPGFGGIIRTWVGGGDNLASDPADWSPTGAPQPGDTLNVTGGLYTINIGGNALAGDPLNIMNGATVAASVSGTGNPPPTESYTINLLNSSLSLAPATGTIAINISGTDTLDYNSSGPSYDPNTTVNLAPDATLHGTITLGSHYGGGNITINGDSSTTFDNDGSSDLIFHNVDISAPVSGIGSFEMGPDKLEFGSSVGAGQTVNVGTYPFSSSVLQIDQPPQFLANAVLHGGSQGSELLPAEIDLMGLATADGYTYQNDMLTIFSGNTPIDVLHMTDQTTNGFTVEKTASSVNILAITTNPIQMASATDVTSLPNI